MRHILIFVNIFIASLLSAQSPLLDSLYQQLEEAPSVIHEIDIWLGISRIASFERNITLVEESANKAIALSIENNYARGEIIATLLYHTTLCELGEVERATTYLNAAFEKSNHSKEPSTKAFVLYHLAGYYEKYYNDIDTALHFLHEALQHANEHTSFKDIGNVHKTIGLCYEFMGKDSLALHHYELALDYFKRPFIHTHLGRPSAMQIDNGQLNIGQTYLYMGELFSASQEAEKGIAYAQKAVDIYEDIGMSSYIVWSKEVLGKIYLLHGKQVQALENFRHALSLSELGNNPVDLGHMHRYIGLCYVKLMDFQQGMYHYDKSLSFFEQTTDTLSIIETTLYIGNLSKTMGQVEKGRNYLKKAERISHQIGDSSMLDVIYVGFARIMAEEQQLEEAIQVSKNGLALSRKYKRDVAEAELLTLLADLYMTSGMLDSAEVYAKATLDLSQQKLLLFEEEDAWLALTAIYEKAGDYQQAFAAQQSYLAIHDSIYTRDVQNILRQEQVRQDVKTFEAEKEAASLKAELLSSQNRLYLILALALFSILLLGGYLFFQLRKTKQALEAKNQQLIELNATKDKFFGIIAHDIRSPILALENVGSQMDYYLKKGKTDKLQRLSTRIDTTAKRLTSLLDNLLNWALLQQGVIPHHPDAISLNEIVEQNLEMFQMSANLKDIDLENQLTEEITVLADSSALNTILRNLISNAIKFTPKGGKVHINALTEKQNVLIRVQDSGVGMNEHQIKSIFALNSKSQRGTAGERGTGLGLILCKELVQLNKGAISVKSQPQQGSDFNITLPLAA
ncbi:MAG: ATP-binding protein [Bacteroidota bacterium]